MLVMRRDKEMQSQLPLVLLEMMMMMMIEKRRMQNTHGSFFIQLCRWFRIIEGIF